MPLTNEEAVVGSSGNLTYRDSELAISVLRYKQPIYSICEDFRDMASGKSVRVRPIPTGQVFSKTGSFLTGRVFKVRGGMLSALKGEDEERSVTLGRNELILWNDAKGCL